MLRWGRLPRSRGLALARVLVALALGLVGYVVMSRMYAETYVWQSTYLTSLVRPVHRTSCPVPRPAATSKAAPSAQRIGVVTLLDDGPSAALTKSDEDLMQSILENRRAYCDKHGYQMVVARGDAIDRSRPAAWSKLLVVLKQLASGQFDFVFYMDLDVVVTNPSFSLESLVQAFPEADVVMTEDWSGPNTGSWLARNSKWTAGFLQLAWDQGASLVEKRDKATGRKHPFEYEQRVIHQLLDTELWRKRGLPSYASKASGGVDGAADLDTAANIRKHFSFAAQCLFNSYALHPLDSRLISGVASVESSQWVPGDFAIHFAGKKGRAKTDLIRHFLDTSSVVRSVHA